MVCFLSFAFVAVRVPDRGDQRSLTAKVKENAESVCSYFPEPNGSSRAYNFYRTVETKVHDRDLRSAVRLLTSECAIAPKNDATLNALRAKHPEPSRPQAQPPEPDSSTPFYVVADGDVARAINSFYNGSASGLDGIRPLHLKELISTTAGNNGRRLLGVLTRLCNFLLRGMLNPLVTPYLYGVIQRLIPGLRALGLEVKCEFFACGQAGLSAYSCFEAELPGLRRVEKEGLTLLGAPIFQEAVPAAMRAKNETLLSLQNHFAQMSSHIALILLRNCFGLPRLTYMMRTSPTWRFPLEVDCMDQSDKGIFETILNVSLDNGSWSQASLPIRHGGLGVRRVRDAGLPAFLASANGVAGLVTRLLTVDGTRIVIPFEEEAMMEWSGMCPNEPPPSAPTVQREWDGVRCKIILQDLMSNATGSDLARLRAASEVESGAWLHAVPSPHLGTHLDNDSLRVAVALRLGCGICVPHTCVCGAAVEANGFHGLSFVRCAGRFSRHHAINDIIRRALVSANVPCVVEPPGLSRTDGKRPDGLTLVPWQKGLCLLWDATCMSTFAATHISGTIREAGSRSEAAAVRKHSKYAVLKRNYLFVPFAVEAAGPWGHEAKAKGIWANV